MESGLQSKKTPCTSQACGEHVRSFSGCHASQGSEQPVRRKSETPTMRTYSWGWVTQAPHTSSFHTVDSASSQPGPPS